MNPSEPNCRGLLQEDVKKLRSGNWGLRKKWLRRCFQAMVSTHYEDHLSELGIEFLRDEKNVSVSFNDAVNKTNSSLVERCMEEAPASSPVAAPKEASHHPSEGRG